MSSQVSPSPAESPVQKLDRKSREALVQLARGLADLSHLHSAALEGQLRFRQGTAVHVRGLTAILIT
jgi:hypothetical protein